MLFTPERIQKILDLEKTQTRRPADIVDDLTFWNSLDQITEVRRRGQVKFKLGRDYAVQPGRGKPCVQYAAVYNQALDRIERKWTDAKAHPARIQITQIRREDVRKISPDDARAEGFQDPLGFLAAWVEMYDKPWSFCQNMDSPLFSLYLTRDVAKATGYPKYGWQLKQSADAICRILATRPAERYQAWALTFRLL